MRAKLPVLGCLTLLLLLCASAVHTQIQQKTPAPSTRSAPVVRRDNYNDLRAKYRERLEREERERERRKPEGKEHAEDQFEGEFIRWDHYWLDHLDAASHEPGKMADMAGHMHDYFSLGQRAGNARLASQPTALICPSAGLGNWTSLGPSMSSSAGTNGIAAPIMGKVTSVYLDPNHLNTAYVGSAHGGLFKTASNGSTWTSLTDASHYPSLGITSIALHPSVPQIVYLGTTNGEPGYSNCLGGEYGFGILKTTNGGASWQESLSLTSLGLNIDEGMFVSKVMVHAQDPNTVYALALHTVFRSTDAGNTWQKVLEIVPTGNPNDGCRYQLIDIDIINGANGVANSKVLVSTVRSGWTGGVNSPCGTARAFISTTGGALSGTASSFHEITGAVLGSAITERIAGAVQPGNSSDFFLGYAELSTGAFVLKKYNIASQTATQVAVVTSNGVHELGTGFWNLELQFSELNANTVYVGGTTLYRIDLANPSGGIQVSAYWATDPGTCQPAAQTHADIRGMTVSHNGTKDVVVLGTDGGIHKAEFDPVTAYTTATAVALWHDITGSLALNEFFDISGMQSRPDLLVGGTADNGTFEYNNGVWRQQFNLDGWHGTILQATSQYFSGQYYGMTNGGAIHGPAGTTSTNTTTCTFVAGGGPTIGPYAPIVADPNIADNLYSGDAQLYNSPYGGVLWNLLPSLPGSSGIRAIQVAPSDSATVYVSRGGAPGNNNRADFLFRSNDGGHNNWMDIGANLPALSWARVVNIAVDPDDANRVWVAFNGYWPTSNTSLNGANRVWFSNDGGSTWSDFTFNLLAFPVSTLVYQRGSDDVLYAGTDVGVFRFNKSLQLWECFNNLLPVVPVTKLEINYCKNKIRAATFGRGIYESDLPALPSEIVSTSVTWSGQRYLSNDLTIAPGATLTLTGTLYLSQDKRIIVQRGATLKVNGGTIINACGDMWYGIEVWGTKSAPQSLAGAQGTVLLQNNAKLENAIAAITTGKDVNSMPDLNYTGGIVQASNANFYNNQSSVRFLPYNWLVGTFVAGNASYFKNCKFETNRRLNNATLPLLAHVSLNNIKNVGLLGCKFSNTAAATDYGVNNRGDGVVSTDAEYTVNDLIQPVTEPPIVLAPSVFNGLTYGVRAGFIGFSTKKVLILNSDFNNVQRGVQVNNSAGSQVGRNNFNVLPNALTASFADATWAVRMSNVQGFAVLYNTINGVSAAYQNNYGVIIEGCGSSANNLVQRNTLKNLYTGLFARGLNGIGGNGVQFKCNVFQPSMAYQLSVESGGTLANQGSTCVPGHTADNTFFAQASPAGSQINAPGVAFAYFGSGALPTNISGSVTVTNCLSVVGECSSGPNLKNPALDLLSLRE